MSSRIASVMPLHGTKQRLSLHLASANGPAELVKFLASLLDILDAKDHVGKTALHYACENGRTANVRVMTPLMLAARGGYASIVLLFLQRVATDQVDLLLKDLNGKNVLHWAAEGGHLDCVEAILAHDKEGQLCMQKDARGRTPGNLASKKTVQKRLFEEAEKAIDQDGFWTSTTTLTIVAFAFMIIGLALGVYAMSLDTTV